MLFSDDENEEEEEEDEMMRTLGVSLGHSFRFPVDSDIESVIKTLLDSNNSTHK